MKEQIPMWYAILGLITSIIGMYRAFIGRQGVEANETDVISWMLVWWIFLPIFIIRYIKYKIKGKIL